MSSTSLPLFDTRQTAHARVAPTKQQKYEGIIRFAHDCGRFGFIADELAAAWNCSHNHSSPRVTELVKLGLLVATKRRRPTRTGSPACVFVLPEFFDG